MPGRQALCGILFVLHTHPVGVPPPGTRLHLGHPAHGIVDLRRTWATSPSSSHCSTRSPRHGTDRQTPSTPRRAAGRPRLRPRQVPPPAPAARHPPSGREARRATRPFWASSTASSSARSPGSTACAACAAAGERRDDIHAAFLGLTEGLITHRHVQRLCQDPLFCPDVDLERALEEGTL
ncbi:hypothetical protein STPH2_7185 [Streptomyces sp. KO7888]|nr:hypothetical protein [Streptomyces sp. KO7888]